MDNTEEKRKKPIKDTGKYIREGGADRYGGRLLLVLRLAVPAMIAQIAFIAKDYIDTAMVAKMGYNQSAAIGLVSSSTWLLGNLTYALALGYAVLVAHATGAGDHDRAKRLLKQGVVVTVSFAGLIAVVGASISPFLPVWLNGNPEINGEASAYFLIMALHCPILAMIFTPGDMLRCSGNAFVPGLIDSLSCLFDIIFNFFLIFPTRTVSLFGAEFSVWGAGLGVTGAALGTVLADLVAACILSYFCFVRSPILSIKGTKGGWRPEAGLLKESLKISLPAGLGSCLNSFAMIVSTGIVAPLGNVALAANTFAITAESVCYMPGFGLAEAATTLIGQTIGAKKEKLTSSFARMTILIGMGVMSFFAVILYFICPYIFDFLTPDAAVSSLGVLVLRTELFAEPLFALSIVGTGVLRGAGDTLVPSIMTIASLWTVRLPLAAVLVVTMGLQGAWIAMAIELSVRGLLILARLIFGKWKKRPAAGAL